MSKQNDDLVDFILNSLPQKYFESCTDEEFELWLKEDDDKEIDIETVNFKI
jgi:hypothetical protein